MNRYLDVVRASRSRLSLRNSESMRAGVLNGICGVADYLTQPIGMLLAAPFLLHRLGSAQYGLWMIATAAIGSGGLLSTGFSDMAVKYVAMYRGRDNWGGVVHVVQSSLALNLTLGSIMAVALWAATPFAGLHIFRIQPALQPVFVQSIHIGSIALIVRSLDSIFVSVLRAYEQYRPAVQITVLARALAIIGAVILVARGHGIVSIMVAMLLVNTVGMVLQAAAVRSTVGPVSFRPSWSNELLPAISPFGCYGWLQALSGIIFGQVDRLIVGALLGASPVAYYSICTQAAQAIHGLVASGFHFLFPHLSAKLSTMSLRELAPVIKTAFWANLGLAVLFCLPLAALSHPILSAWMGPVFAARMAPVLSLTALSFGFVGLNVTGHYTLMALGAIRYVTFVNLLAGVAMIGSIALLTRHVGLIGAATGRLMYGPITWVIYWKLYRLITSDRLVPTITVPASTLPEEAF